MKFHSVLLLCAVLPVLSAGEFDVRQFGAKGDGENDDTEAIQAAVTAANKQTRIFRSFGRHKPSSYFGTGQTVTFPPGVYKITRTIQIGNHVSLSGDGGTPMLQWHGEENGVLFDVRAFRNRVERMIFAGGGTHLRFRNNNVDKTMITIRDCQFLYAGGVAVVLEPERGASHLSAQTLVEGCLFSKNYQCAQNYGDLMELRNCWVDQTQPQMADGAAFLNRYGTMRFAFCCLTPSANPDKGPLYYHNARWVDNYSRLEAESVRFGGEGGGLPAVYNYSGPATRHPWTGGGRILIRNCLLACGQQRRENGAVVRLFSLPSQIVLTDNYGLTLAPLLQCDPSLNWEGDLERNPNGMARVSYHVFNNLLSSPMANAVPQGLKRFFTKESDCVFLEMKPRPIPSEVTTGE
ncbi:MAG: hypothetical protein IJJ33_01385 [Victivallales bacterium]|nr:hypothetical protein [Victivallales bacterium]